MNERIAIYIDGSNLFHKLRGISKESLNLMNFNYGKFCDWLCTDERRLIYKGYYVGVVKAKENDESSQKMRLNQRQLFNKLLKQKFFVKKGYLMKSEGKFHEKGVDVNLAVDILVGAYEDLYDSAIIISSDTDLIPAVKKAQSLGKKIEFVGFRYQPSYALIHQCSSSKLLTKADILNFIADEPDTEPKPKREVKNHRASLSTIAPRANKN